MIVVLNGEERELDPGIKMADLIRRLELAPGSVVAECDGNIIEQDAFDSFILKEGCVVELIRFVGGG